MPRPELIQQARKGFNGGQLALSIVEARGLKAMDGGFFNKGTSDPYCEVRVASGRALGRTEAVRKTLDPQWGTSVNKILWPCCQNRWLACYSLQYSTSGRLLTVLVLMPG